MKIEKEPKKLLGNIVEGNGTGIEPHPMIISAMVHRVPVLHGHTISVSLKFSKSLNPKIVVDEVWRAYHEYNEQHRIESKPLPTMPPLCVKVFAKDDEPQPRLHSMEGNGMTVCVGRIRPCEILDVKMVIMCHNTILGAAGGSIANAEFAIASGVLK